MKPTCACERQTWKTVAKSEYQRKDDQDITWESLEVYNARIKGSK